MANVQEIFNRIKVKQGEYKTVKSIEKDVMTNSQEYQLILEEIKALKDKKRKIEIALKSDLRSELDKMDAIKLDIASDREMLSNLALTQLIKGESVTVIDEKNNKYGPIFSVRFEKI